MKEHNILVDTTLVFAQSARSNLSCLTIEEAYVDAHVQLFLAQPSQTVGGGPGKPSYTIQAQKVFMANIVSKS
jgi:hypothetical protein